MKFDGTFDEFYKSLYFYMYLYAFIENIAKIFKSYAHETVNRYNDLEVIFTYLFLTFCSVCLIVCVHTHNIKKSLI